MVDEIDQDTIDMLEYPLRHYIRKKCFIPVLDLVHVILSREEVAEGIYKYVVPDQEIYLGEDGYAVTYGRQKIIDNKVYYRVTTDPNVDDDLAYEYMATLEWMKKELPPEEEL